MKILEVFSQPTQAILTEKLGNLTKLGMPKLLQALKQQIRHGGKRSEPSLEPMPAKGAKSSHYTHGNKFAGNNTGVGAGSTIVDAGEIKKGMADLRKAYKNNENAQAFALYLNSKPVAFGKFDEQDLRGSTKYGIFAYDLTAFSDKLDEMDKAILDQKKSEWEKNNHKPRPKTSIKSVTDKEYDYDSRAYKEIIKHHTGELKYTKQLQDFLDLLAEIGGTITVKLVLPESFEKRQKRNFNRPVGKPDVDHMKRELMDRLKKYKLSKKPSVDNIEDFLKLATEKGAGIVQFAGGSYSLKKGDSYSKIDPVALLNGHSFDIKYDSVDGSYSSISVSYSFDQSTGLLMPISVRWTDKTEAGKSETREEVLNRPVWLKKNKLNPANKSETIKNLLELFKEQNFSDIAKKIKVLRQEGHDWDEFKTIEKSVELEKKKLADKRAEKV